ncbi:MLO-like protein 1 [Typha latifolia]|uniref:MLO-like protein 1 n=1 Tax=Typha latifolia TaxID=4733 RepID=UPI003C2F3E82
MLPCKKDPNVAAAAEQHYSVGFSSGVLGSRRRLLAGGGGGSDHCQKKGKVPLLSLQAIHEIHIFIFVLAVTHVVLSLLTVLLGSAQMRIWKHWENAIQEEEGSVPKKIMHVGQFEFIQDRFKGINRCSSILRWLHSFVKQFYEPVSKSDYTTMRIGFIMTHCRTNPKFNFYKYMIRTLEADFKKVVGISWYLWVFVMVFLLLNVDGWHSYFWISFIPLTLLLVVGTKLEHIFTQLAHEVAEKHSAIEGELVVTPSDSLFWFRRPRVVLFFIHFILFQNAFEIAFFFWILSTYGFNSCIMGRAEFVIPRIIISVFIQMLCSYSTLPLYAIVTQMGSSFKRTVFEENVQEGLVGWAQQVKKRKGKRVINGEGGSSTTQPISGVQMGNLAVEKDSSLEEAKLIEGNSSNT